MISDVREASGVFDSALLVERLLVGERQIAQISGIVHTRRELVGSFRCDRDFTEHRCQVLGGLEIQKYETRFGGRSEHRVRNGQHFRIELDGRNILSSRRDKPLEKIQRDPEIEFCDTRR